MAIIHNTRLLLSTEYPSIVNKTLLGDAEDLKAFNNDPLATIADIKILISIQNGIKQTILLLFQTSAPSNNKAISIENTHKSTFLYDIVRQLHIKKNMNVNMYVFIIPFTPTSLFIIYYHVIIYKLYL